MTSSNNRYNQLYSLLHSRFSISKSKFNSDNLDAKAFVKGGRSLVSPMLRINHVMGVKVSRNWARVIVRYLSELNRLYQHSGKRFVVFYLKGCTVLLQQVVAGYKISDLGPLKCRISRSKTGLPRIIPKFHRKLILQGDLNVVRFWMTLFSLYRDLHIIGELKLKSITAPSQATSRAPQWGKYVDPFKDLFFKEDDWNWEDCEATFQILKSGPQVESRLGETNTSISALMRSFSNFYHRPALMQNLQTLLRLGNQNKILTLIKKLEGSVSWMAPYYKPLSPYLGRLALKREAAGKVRVFAMVDAWTQWALRPLHDTLFKVLGRIPMDGTFDQLKPLSRVPWGERPIYSDDLSSATDRLPIWLQEKILAKFTSVEYARNWVELLVNRDYKVPSGQQLSGLLGAKEAPKSVRYAVGQPMGALSSWAMLAITHHYIIQSAAWDTLVKPIGVLFMDYAVLGDDVVIWDKKVRQRYLTILKSLGVEVGLSKSVASEEGVGLEFAKRTLIKGKDCSPIPFKEVSSAHRNFAALRTFAEKYQMDTLRILRFLGYGYRIDPTKINSRIMRVLRVVFSIPRTPEELRDLLYSDQIHTDYKHFTRFKPNDIRRSTLEFLLTEVNDLLDQAEHLLDDVRTVRTSSYVDRIGPWRTEEAEIRWSILEHHLKPAHEKLGGIIGMLKLARIELGSLQSRSTFSMVELAALGSYLGHWVNSYSAKPLLTRTSTTEKDMNLIIWIMKEMYESQEYLDSIQLKLLLNPVPQLPVTPQFKESIRTLRNWIYWANKLSQIKDLRDLSQLNLPGFRKKTLKDIKFTF